MSRYQPPELLAARHLLAGFRCRSEEQTSWLVEVAKQAHGAGTTRVFVVTEVDQSRVVAYYAWCMASVAIADLPERLRRGAGRYPSPLPCWPASGWTTAMKARASGRPCCWM